MEVLLAVALDLYTFTVSMLFPRRTGRNNTGIPLYLPSLRVISPIREITAVDVYRDKEAVCTDEVADGATDADKTFLQKNTIVYCARANVPLRTAPDSVADTAIAMLAYGDIVMMLEGDIEYSYVAVGNKKGYVPTAVLVQEAASVYPEFVIGAENTSHDTATVRLRAVICDEFGAGLIQASLQPHEYVYYKLLRRGVHIAWPDIRPRTAGSWAKILGTLAGVIVSDTPTVGSVMEWILPQETMEGKAHLAYVEKVFPDGTIHISEVDSPDRGVYFEEMLGEDEWRKLGAIYIALR